MKCFCLFYYSLCITLIQWAWGIDDFGNDNVELEQEEQSAVVVAIEVNPRVRWNPCRYRC